MGDSPRRAKMRKKIRKKMRKIKKILLKFEERMRKLTLLPTRNCEAGYGPVFDYSMAMAEHITNLSAP